MENDGWQGAGRRASDEARRAKERRTTVRTGAVPFHFARLRAKGGSRLDVADDRSEDFIERAAVEFEKLLDGEAIGIPDRIGFALRHGDFLS